MPILIVLLAFGIIGLVYILIYNLQANALWVDVYHTFGSGREAGTLHAELEEHGVRCKLRTLDTPTEASGQRLTTVRVHRDDLRKAQPIVADMQRRRWS